MPRSQSSALAMSVPFDGGGERRRRLDRRRLARVEGANGSERVAQERMDQDEPVLGNGETGDADALAHLVQSDVGGICAHRGASFAESARILPGRLATPQAASRRS